MGLEHVLMQDVSCLVSLKSGVFDPGEEMAEVTYPCYWQKKDGSDQWYWIYYEKRKSDRAKQ
jgi:hypothetical protein